jgi:transposase
VVHERLREPVQVGAGHTAGGRNWGQTPIFRRRRLSKDYERLPKSSEAMIYLSMTRLMLRRLTAT